jgi:hypothetical protein
MTKKIISILLAMLLSSVMLLACAPPPPETPPPAVQYELKLRTRTYSLKDEERKKLDIVFTADKESADWSLLTFTSKNPEIAMVDEYGIITGISAGTTTVDITIGEKKVTANVIVTMRKRRVTLSASSFGLLQGETATLTATAYIGSEKDNNAQITWSSSNPEIVSVDNGTITAVANGSATITATYGEVSSSAIVNVVGEATAEQVNSFNEEVVNIFGRTYINANGLNFDHGANAIELGIIGTSLDVNLTASANSYMRVWVDDVEQADRIKITPATKKYTVVSGLGNSYHKIRIVKATEMQNAIWDIKSFEAEKFASVPEKSEIKIEFVGDSISAGYGALGSSGQPWSVDNSDCTRSYTYYTAQKLGVDYSVVSWSGICAKAYHWQKGINMNTLYKKISYSNSSNYTTDDKPQVIVLNLGTNEASYLNPTYGGPSYANQFPADYKEMLTTIRTANPDAYIICLYGMMGADGRITSGIMSAVEQMNDNKIVYNPISVVANNSGANGHPTAFAQEGWAMQLADYIKTLSIVKDYFD